MSMSTSDSSPTIGQDRLSHTMSMSTSDSSPTKKVYRKPWVTNEDSLLLQLVEKYGTVRKWPVIAVEMRTRTGKQCWERYHNHLKPEIVKVKWTAQEDTFILSAKNEIGKKWSYISKSMEGRSDNDVKNRWNFLNRNNMSNKEAPQSHTPRVQKRESSSFSIVKGFGCGNDPSSRSDSVLSNLDSSESSEYSELQPMVRSSPSPSPEDNWLDEFVTADENVKKRVFSRTSTSEYDVATSYPCSNEIDSTYPMTQTVISEASMWSDFSNPNPPSFHTLQNPSGSTDFFSLFLHDLKRANKLQTPISSPRDWDFQSAF